MTAGPPDIEVVRGPDGRIVGAYRPAARPELAAAEGPVVEPLVLDQATLPAAALPEPTALSDPTTDQPADAVPDVLAAEESHGASAVDELREEMRRFEDSVSALQADVGTPPTNTGASLAAPVAVAQGETNPMFVRTPEEQQTADFFRQLTGAQKKAEEKEVKVAQRLRALKRALCAVVALGLLLTALYLTTGCGAVACAQHGECDGKLLGLFAADDCHCSGDWVGGKCDVHVAHGSCSGGAAGGTCSCTDGFAGEQCQLPPAVVISGCHDASNCGTFRRTDVSCDGAPLFRDLSDGDVLYLWSSGGGVSWVAGTSWGLFDCYARRRYLRSGAHSTAASPTVRCNPDLSLHARDSLTRGVAA